MAEIIRRTSAEASELRVKLLSHSGEVSSPAAEHGAEWARPARLAGYYEGALNVLDWLLGDRADVPCGGGE